MASIDNMSISACYFNLPGKKERKVWLDSAALFVREVEPKKLCTTSLKAVELTENLECILLDTWEQGIDFQFELAADEDDDKTYHCNEAFCINKERRLRRDGALLVQRLPVIDIRFNDVDQDKRQPMHHTHHRVIDTSTQTKSKLLDSNNDYVFIWNSLTPDAMVEIQDEQRSLRISNLKREYQRNDGEWVDWKYDAEIQVYWSENLQINTLDIAESGKTFEGFPAYWSIKDENHRKRNIFISVEGSDEGDREVYKYRLGINGLDDKKKLGRSISKFL